MTVNQLSGCDTRQLWATPLTLSVINVEMSYKKQNHFSRLLPGCNVTAKALFVASLYWPLEEMKFLAFNSVT